MTGSRIRRRDHTANAPITTVDEALFQETTSSGRRSFTRLYAEGLAGNPNPNGNIGSYQLFSLAAGYSFKDRYTLRVGIENLFDKDPPLSGGNANATPFPTARTRVSGSTYDPLGRAGTSA